MIKQLLIILFVLCSSTLSAQVYVDGANTNTDSAVKYIEIVHAAYPSMFYIEAVDAGMKKHARSKLTDQTGKRLSFHNTVDLLDYMKKNGWSMIRRDIVSGRSGNTLAFLLFEKSR